MAVLALVLYWITKLAVWAARNQSRRPGTWDRPGVTGVDLQAARPTAIATVAVIPVAMVGATPAGSTVAVATAEAMVVVGVAADTELRCAARRITRSASSTLIIADGGPALGSRQLDGIASAPRLPSA